MTQSVSSELSEAILESTKIRQIIINLLGNAVKFTNHGSVNVEVAFCLEDGGLLPFSIKDTGSGIRKPKCLQF